MTLNPAFSADAQGVISHLGWDDPSNISPVGASSIPVNLVPTGIDELDEEPEP